MKFRLEKSRIGSDFVAGLPEDSDLLSYDHEIGFDDITFEKKLTSYDITTGFLMLPYEKFGGKTFEEKMTTIKIVDDCGNIWNCILIVYGSFPNKHFKKEWDDHVYIILDR
ncbi:DNA helicase [Trifolium repens]|nr:DNA helicase [Trifolium repens]